MFKNDKGSVALVFALAAVPALGVLGATLDYSRASNARVVLQESVDSAALAALSNPKKPADKDLAIKIFNQRSAVDTTMSSVSPVVIVHSDNRIEVRGTAKVKTIIPVNGKTYMDVNTSSIASRGVQSQAQDISLKIKFDGADAWDLNEIYLYTIKSGSVALDVRQFLFSNATGATNKDVSVSIDPGDVWGFMFTNKKGGRIYYGKDGPNMPNQYSHTNPPFLRSNPIVCDGKTKNMHYWDDSDGQDQDFNDMVYSFVCTSSSGDKSGVSSKVRIEK
jgi:hypothetical protein